MIHYITETKHLPDSDQASEICVFFLLVLLSPLRSYTLTEPELISNAIIIFELLLSSLLILNPKTKIARPGPLSQDASFAVSPPRRLLPLEGTLLLPSVKIISIETTQFLCTALWSSRCHQPITMASLPLSVKST